MPAPAPEPLAPIEILGMRIEASPIVLKWGGTIVGNFTLRVWPYLVGDCRLVRRPDDTYVVSLNMGARRSRVTIQDDRHKAALVAAAVAAFQAKMAHLRPAVSASREGFRTTETPP